MDTTGTKILAMCLLGGISIILGFIPLKLGKVFKSKDGDHKHGTIFSSLLCFGGGVLLATSLLHMLPEVSKLLRFIKSVILLPCINLFFDAKMHDTTSFNIFRCEKVLSTPISYPKARIICQ